MQYLDEFRRRNRYNIDPLKPLRVIGWVLVVLGVLWMAPRLLVMAFIHSAERARPVPQANTEETRRIVADVGLKLPQSVREVDAFWSGIVDHTIYSRLTIPTRDLERFTHQKLLAGKWKDGKGLLSQLPRIVARSWRELAHSDDTGWRCWNGWVPYVKSEGELWGLDIAIGPASNGETMVYLRLTQT